MNKNNGAILILTSALFYATYGIWSRIMGSAFGEFSQAWSRGLMLLITVLFLNWRFKIFKPVQKRDLPWLIAIGLAGGLNQAPYYFGFQNLSIGTATLLFYTGLVIGGFILGKIFFGEKMTLVKVISLILAMTGMTLIYKFQLIPKQFWAATLTIVAGLLGSMTVILPRKLIGGYHEFQIMVSYFLAQIFFNGIFSFIFHDSLPPITSVIPWLGQIAYAVALILANWAAIEGYRKFDAGLGSLIGLAEIIFGVIFGVIIFHEVLSIGIIAGSLIIVFAAALPHIVNKKQT